MGILPNPCEHSTRKFILWSSALSFPFVIATIVVSIDHRYRNWYHHNDDVIPIAFSFIPLAISIGTSAIFLAAAHDRKRKEAEQEQEAGTTREHAVSSNKPSDMHKVWIFFDILAPLGYIGVLIPVWIIEPSFMGGGDMILESYATVFLLANMVCHFYLACKGIKKALGKRGYPYTECPNCHHDLTPPEPQIPLSAKTDGRGVYAGVRGEIYLDEEGEVGEDASLLPTQRPEIVKASIEA